MKYLSDYTNEAQAKLFEECGAFFAFSKEQLNEGIKKIGASKENKIVSFGGGGYVLSKNIDLLIDGLNNIQQLGIKRDIEENGIKNIIHRELGNYECQIDRDISRAVEALEDYGITYDQVKEDFKEYFQKCIDNDWF